MRQHVKSILYSWLKVKSAYKSSGPSSQCFSLVSVAWSDNENIYFPLDGMLVYHRVTPSIKFASTLDLYTWVERSTAWVKCLAQEHNTMSLARAQTPTAQSRGKCTNHEARHAFTMTLTDAWIDKWMRDYTAIISKWQINNDHSLPKIAVGF